MLKGDGLLRSRPRAASEDRRSSHSRMLSRDEEVGKRDDDYRPAPRTLSLRTSNALKPWKWRKRRVFGCVAVIALVYMFVKNIPTDLGSIDQRVGHPLRPGHVVHGAQESLEPVGVPPRTGTGAPEIEGARKHFYNGEIKFYRLASSLRGIGATQGARAMNRNVLFAASSLKSAANLMPMACEMARWRTNYVHFAIMARDAIPLEQIVAVNGVANGADCPIFFHDARSDYTEYSSDYRAELSVRDAMKHINDFMHPQVMIMDDSAVEDQPFTRSMRRKAKELHKTLIEVPAGRYEAFMWLTRLDCRSLSSWFEPTVDILIHAPQGSSGGLTRLLNSLEHADYAGLKIPSLTIEMPPEIEPFAQRYLADLTWPPNADASPLASRTVAFRHRIVDSRTTSEQASLRFLESFYPASGYNNHVLILSTQSELSTQYMHYLHYLILRYRHSGDGPPDPDTVLGISLDVPKTFISGNGKFVVPMVSELEKNAGRNATTQEHIGPTPFLYQAPSTSASLVFGDKWIALHDFLAKRVAVAQDSKARATQKLVAETEPAWMEYLLELMRARGWGMLHPPMPFLTLHNELAQIPEEFHRAADGSESPESAPADLDAEPFLRASEPPILLSHAEADTSTTDALPLHQLLPFEGEMPHVSRLPYITHTGEFITSQKRRELQDSFSSSFRELKGGCTADVATKRRLVREGSAGDLFCLPGQEIEYDDLDHTADNEEEDGIKISDTEDEFEFP